jgi:hypothetical protein
MGFMTRLSNGWQIAMNSFKVLKANRQLIIFPVLSGISLILIMTSFVLVTLGISGWDINNVDTSNPIASYAIIFVNYLVN